MEYRFELINEHNIKDLPSLFKDAFQEDYSLKYLQGKFNSLHEGGELFSFVAYDLNNSIAGLYAIFPMFITQDQNRILAGQVGDIMIHSEHRKSRDLFFTLANHAHNYAKEKGMKCIFAFVYGINGSYPLFTRYLDFQDDEKFVGYNLKVKTVPMSKYSKKYRLVGLTYQFYFSLIKAIMVKKRNEFLFFDKDMGYPEIHKDENFISYKLGYSNCEIWEVNRVRFLVKVNRDGSLGIGDVDNCSSDEVSKAISKMKNIAFWMGVRILQFEVSENHFIDQILSQKETRIHNRHLLYLNLDEKFPGDKVKYTFSELDTY